MSAHDSSHEDWLVMRLSGETLAAEIEQKIDACTECQAALADLRRLEATLETAGNLERAGTRRAFPSGESSGRKIVPGDDLAAGRRSRPHPVPISRIVRVAAAILVLATIGIAFRAMRPDRPESGTTLGGATDWRLEPTGEVTSVTQFSFEAELPSAGSFVVRVYDELGTTRVPILESPFLQEPRWILEPADIAKLPGRFRWEVRVLDATNIEVAKSSAHVVVAQH